VLICSSSAPRPISAEPAISHGGFTAHGPHSPPQTQIHRSRPVLPRPASAQNVPPAVPLGSASSPAGLRCRVYDHIGASDQIRVQEMMKECVPSRLTSASSPPGRYFEHQTLNPEPKTRNPQPSTLQPEP
jgi:hypothetical protein